jgi:hypothetical protein
MKNVSGCLRGLNRYFRKSVPQYVVAMSGTTGTAESLRVIELLDKMGKLD